jgi:hypothetical protein
VKRIDKDHLPVPVGEMALYRKTALTPMFRCDGPFVVVTQEGEYTLPDGWEGFVAIDKAHYPYPIELTEHRETYEPAGEQP